MNFDFCAATIEYEINGLFLYNKIFLFLTLLEFPCWNYSKKFIIILFNHKFFYNKFSYFFFVWFIAIMHSVIIKIVFYITYFLYFSQSLSYFLLLSVSKVIIISPVTYKFFPVIRIAQEIGFFLCFNF